jgi:excisionase family DNA binding protein
MTLTVDHAAEFLGLSRRAIVELIAEGKLIWTMAADKRTVLVKMPSDTERFLRDISCSLDSPAGGARQPLRPTQPIQKAVRRPSATRTVSDDDAWSQPK